MLGYSAEELLGKPFQNFVFPEDLKEVEKRHEERMEGKSSGYELRLIRKDGEIIWVHVNGSPFVKSKVFSGSIGMIADITEFKKKDLERQEANRRYQSLFEDSPIPTWEEDFSQVKDYLDGLKKQGVKNFREYFEGNQQALIDCARLMIVNDVNDAVLKLNGAPTKEYLLKNYRSLATKRSAEYAIRQFEAIARGKNTCEFDAELRTFHGERIHVHLKWTVVKGYEDSYEKVYLTTADVTQRILAENERLRKANLQQELLLKEIHHRVKNNLQIITSLLRLQSNTIDDEKVKQIFNVSLNRINSMALVHDLLYREKDLSSIEFRLYLDRLIDSLINSMKCMHCDIQYELEMKPLKMNISTSILLGLLINELVTNSVKHGFKDQNEGRIYIKLTEVEDQKYQLEVGDNGCGFEMVEDIDTIDSLGLQLTHNLVDQLNGDIEKLEKGAGTHFQINFAPF
jgi:two-component sensor histidine kinase/PAS domain-containing protein